MASDQRFHRQFAAIPLSEVARLSGSTLSRGDETAEIVGFASLDSAGMGDLTFLESQKYIRDLEGTNATACICSARHEALVPSDVATLLSDHPHRAYLQCLAAFYPEDELVHGAFLPSDAAEPSPASSIAASSDRSNISPSAHIDPSAVLEAGVTVEPGAVIADRAHIGSGSIIGANSVIGSGVAIGRNSVIGPHVTVQYALLGNHVILHPGVRIGQDGFGYQPSPTGHKKVPQLGRVIIQDRVEIGANTTIDRGANRDTVIGEGTKIDNMVQIGHNVHIGRHCVIVSQVGLAGSVRLGDFVMMGGQSGVAGHVTIGDQSKIAATSAVKDDVPPGATWGGVPARPIMEVMRELAIIRKLAQKKRPAKSSSESN